MLLGKYLNKYYKKYWYCFLIGIIFLIGVDFLQTLIPDYLGQIVDNIETIKVDDQFGRMIFAILGCALGIFVGRFTWRVTIFYASGKIEAGLRHEMFLKSERLPVQYYHDNNVGTIMAWFTTDLETIEEYLGFGTIMMIDAIFLSAICIIQMIFKCGYVLTLIAAVPLILIVIWGTLVEKFMSMKWENRQKAFDNLYDYTQENFTGIRVIKAFVKETQELHAFAKVARKNEEVNVNFQRVSILFDVAIEIIIAMCFTIILGFGGWFIYGTVTGQPVLGVKLTIGQLITFTGEFDLLIWPMIALGQIVTMKSRSKASLKRITNYLDTEETVKNPENAIILEGCKGNIEFNHYSFKYPSNDYDSLTDITLKINAGETIGVVGKIGCGKTTLVNSLLRLYNVNENSILIDGNDIMKVDIKSLRDNIAYVPQDNFLFSDKVSNNIAFSNKDLPQEKIEDAARFADVHDNIVDFHEGYNTISGERGVTLSGGQKQRISIARAYIKDAPIMILDDSVSAVDIKTEETILANIKEFRKDKTTILIASRVSTVSHLSKIIVLNDGKLEAFGTHKDLLKNSPTYQKMVYLQQLEQEVEGGAN